jgi:hypothetical protein
MRRHLREPEYEWAQKRLGVDVARFGDDRTVIFPRQGLVAFAPTIIRHARGAAVSTDIATAVAAKKATWDSELELMDATGGWAAGARDVLLTSGTAVVEVQFAGKALDPRYENRRAELWFAGASWVQRGAALPHVPELVAELTAPTYTFTRKGRFLIEPKEMVKARLGRSPDLADALFITFGMPEMPRGAGGGQGVGRALRDADPYAISERR